MKKCFRCGGLGQKVIYKGLPLKMCSCMNCVFGNKLTMKIHAYLFDIDRDGYFFHYEGAYLPALWQYLRTPHPDADHYA